MLLIGSGASGIFGRFARDTDYIVTPETFKQIRRGQRSGYYVCYPLDAEHYVVKDTIIGEIDEYEIAYPGSTGEDLLRLLDVLLALKLSHRFKKSTHFLKTMEDIWKLREHGAKVPACLQDWLKRRQKETLAAHAHPKLNQNSKGFFGPEITYVYVHDTIHLAMAINGQPAYKRFQKDGAEVTVDRAKWDALDDFWKIRSVLEECYVLALERHQIPNDFKPNPLTSFKIALEKTCTTIASGWWREWAWEHYYDALEGFTPDYIQWFKAGVASGLVKKVDA
jgi:hypothetical protein